MNRIEERLELLKNKDKKAFITYMTAGLPNLAKTAEVIKAQTEAGVDIIELGVPFSDPVADGPVIQNASFKSIAGGTNIQNIFEMVKEVRKTCEIPLVFMMYYNTILYYGVEKFISKCIEVGIDGLIVPDVPFEEQDEITMYLDKENAPILIQLVAPVSKDRIPMLVSKARGFIYCVSSMGVTGQGAQAFHKDVAEYLQSVKAVSKAPVMMGFGIKAAADVEPFKDFIDGCIVGSAFIQLMEENDYDLEVIKDYIKTFKRDWS